ncbi:hypothetical protein ABQG64_06270, partial [Escherichia coli]
GHGTQQVQVLAKAVSVFGLEVFRCESGGYRFQGPPDQGNLPEVGGIDGGREGSPACLRDHQPVIFEFAQGLPDRGPAHLHVFGQLRFVDRLIGTDVQGDDPVRNDPVGDAGQ